MQQFLSKTMPVSVSRKMLEDLNKINDMPPLSSSPHSYSSLRSISPDPFDPRHSLHRQPTFSYIPIHKRRRSGSPTLIRSISFNSISTSVPSQLSLPSATSIQTPDSEMPTTPTSLFSSISDQSMEYTSFPNLEKFADECWTEIRVEEKKEISTDIQMESYDEMLVGGVRFYYT
ncbi:12326_t:CDS:2 [Funneliformis geosporum]|uniref:13320_t:CDS:1 n=1 Tax=Funneliformis geosporum TaxID=1117311 RepID=A0A9W4SPY3_9GLOM|nr:12326_t:CDS:2 [Funneliformis geosporum]CAI2178416.1 13320_t:CDS:2 [Funneliformis geosporum]